MFEKNRRIFSIEVDVGLDFRWALGLIWKDRFLDWAKSEKYGTLS